VNDSAPSNSESVDISPENDGGVLKQILKVGEGEERPNTGDKVFVHYVGKLEDGSVFDSSRDRGDKFEFTLGVGNVIKGWDIGVATMLKDEVCLLTCKSEYAYGDNGSPPKIPGGATLIFEVELFDWKGEDLSADKDEGIVRKVIKKGTGYVEPNEGAEVQVHLKGTYNNTVLTNEM